jgi:hypothetical protein
VRLAGRPPAQSRLTPRRPAVDTQGYAGGRSGPRVFRADEGDRVVDLNDFCPIFLVYRCKNCTESKKTYALLIGVGPGDVYAKKLGEEPSFGERFTIATCGRSRKATEFVRLEPGTPSGPIRLRRRRV